MHSLLRWDGCDRAVSRSSRTAKGNPDVPTGVHRDSRVHDIPADHRDVDVLHDAHLRRRDMDHPKARPCGGVAVVAARIVPSGPKVACVPHGRFETVIARIERRAGLPRLQRGRRRRGRCYRLPECRADQTRRTDGRAGLPQIGRACPSVGKQHQHDEGRHSNRDGGDDECEVHARDERLAGNRCKQVAELGRRAFGDAEGPTK